MPEAPSIIILCQQVRQFVGKKVLATSGKIGSGMLDRIEGCNLLDVRSYGKQLLLIFPDFSISVHLMLFGTYAINSRKSGNLSLQLSFSAGSISFFSSVIKILDRPPELLYNWKLDLMNENLDHKLVLENIKRKPGMHIADALIDQHNFAGVGNKIRNEVLFRTAVHPLNKVGDIPDKKLREILEDCVKFSFELLEWKLEGQEEENFLIYRKKICPRDKIPVIAEKLKGRTIYYCDKCQQLYN